MGREGERGEGETDPTGDFSPAASACRGNTKELNRPLRRPVVTECLLPRGLFKEDPSRSREEELFCNFGGTEASLLVSRGGFETFVASGAAAGTLECGTLDSEVVGLVGMERRSALR